MAHVTLFMMVSLDGYFEGPNHDISWHNVDTEFNTFASEMIKKAGVLLFGRRTYELMEGYWPTEKPSDPADAIVAQQMNVLPKIVFSQTMQRVEEKANWQHVTLKHDIVPDEVQQLKQTTQGPIMILGSNALCVSMMKMGLVDEFHIMVNPIAIGAGTPLFHGITERVRFHLLRTKTFASHNTLLVYEKE